MEWYRIQQREFAMLLSYRQRVDRIRSENQLEEAMSKKKKKKTMNSPPKPRNWLAVQAFRRKAGAIKDKKKEAQKKACRKKDRPFHCFWELVF